MGKAKGGDRRERKKRIEAAVAAAAAPALAAMGYELVEASFGAEGGEDCLEIVIDRLDGGPVGIDDCEKASLKLDPIVDAIPGLDGTFNFDVSSPGLDRPLKTERDFERNAGHEVEVKLFEPADGSRIWTGELIGLRDGAVAIDTGKEKDGVRAFPREKVALVKRTIRF